MPGLFHQVLAEKGEEVMETCAIEMVNPRTAESWLETNRRNRGRSKDRGQKLVDDDRVDQYVGIIMRREWRVNNDAITFDTKGVLQNGFHRLTAVVRSGVTIPMLILRGVEPDTYETMDRGGKRTLAQVLADHGESYSTNLAALANAAFMYAQGRYGVGTRTHGWPTAHQARLFIDDNPEIRDSARKGQLVADVLKCSALAMGLAHFICTQINDIDADVFFDQLKSGEGLHKQDPIYELRARLMSEGRGPKRLTNKEQVALTFKAWNFWRRGESVSLLKYVPGGSRPEMFPEPI